MSELVERWKYTSLRALDNFPFLTSSPSHADVPELPFKTSGRLVFVDGHFLNHLSLLPASVSVEDMAAVFPTDNPFAMKSKITAAPGLQISIENNAKIIHPIDCVFLFTDKAKDCAMHRHHRIQVKNNTQVSFVMRYIGENNTAYLSNNHTELNIDAKANVTLYHFQLQGDQAFHIENIAIKQAEDSQIAIHSLSLGALLARMDMGTDYQNHHASSRMYGIYYVSGKQHVDYHLDANHYSQACQTQQHVKGCVDEQARAVFNGKVAVKKGAIKSVSEQSHHGLLLSRRARIDAKPELEIDCDDIRCIHGATVGALRKESLFYLMSRGIAECQAKAILELAHVSSLLDTIEVPDIKAYMHAQLMKVALKQEAPCLM